MNLVTTPLYEEVCQDSSGVLLYLCGGMLGGQTTEQPEDEG